MKEDWRGRQGEGGCTRTKQLIKSKMVNIIFNDVSEGLKARLNERGKDDDEGDKNDKKWNQQ